MNFEDEGRVEYLRLLSDASRYLDFRGVPQVRRVVLFELDDLFVPLNGIIERRERVEPSGLSPSELESEYLPPEMRERMEREFYRETVRTETLPMADVISKHEDVVILGDPGSGKSTTLKHIAFSLAQKLLGEGESIYDLPDGTVPIPITLRFFAHRLRKGHVDSLEDYIKRFVASDLYEIKSTLDRQLERASESDSEIRRKMARIGQFLDETIKSGRAILLLDGLDEVAAGDLRNNLRRKVLEFKDRYPQHRYVVTSRKVGYAPGEFSDFQHVELAGFDDDQLKDFVHRWYRAYEQAELRIDGLARFKADEAAAELYDEIVDKPQIHGIASNPLLATIIALIHTQGTKLPNQRVELYEKCSETFIWAWESSKRLEGIIGETMNPRETDMALAEIALWMHRYSDENLIHRDKLVKIIKKFAVETLGVDETRADEYARKFIDLVVRRAGMFIERGPDRFGFIHLTFQEYFVGKALNVFEYGRGYRYKHLIPKHLWDPKWIEPIVLGAGIAGRKGVAEASEYIETILSAESMFEIYNRAEKYLHHRLLTAAKCLIDDVPVWPPLRDRIIDDVVELYLWAWEKDIWSLRKIIGKEIFTHAHKSRYGEVFASRFLPRLEHEYSKIRYATLIALDKLKIRSSEVIEKIAERLEDEDSGVREVALEVLGGLGVQDSEVIAKIAERLEDEDSGVLREALKVLGELGVQDSEVVEKIAERLEDENGFVRVTALEVLRELGVQDSKVVEKALVKIFV